MPGNICRLIKPPLFLLFSVKRNRDDPVRFPPDYIFFPEKEDCLCIKYPIFPSSVIFIFLNGKLPHLIIRKNSFSLHKIPLSFPTVSAVFCLLIHLSAAFHAPCPGYRADFFLALRTDKPLLFPQNLMTEGTASRI